METRTAQDMIDVLNEVLALDEEALNILLTTRVSCNEALANHNTVQVRQEDDGNFSLSLLGILNGLFGNIGGDGERKNWGHIMMICEWDEETEEPGRIHKFERTPEEA